MYSLETERFQGWELKTGEFSFLFQFWDIPSNNERPELQQQLQFFSNGLLHVLCKIWQYSRITAFNDLLLLDLAKIRIIDTMNALTKISFVFAVLFSVVLGDFNFKYTQDDKDLCPPLSEKDQLLAKLNVTTGGPYTYSQSAHHFYGVGYGQM